MLTLDNLGSEICVVGRCDFTTGIGLQTYAMCELLSRFFPVCILPTEPQLKTSSEICLPNSRRIPVCSDPSSIRVSIFVDVVWNGAHDYNYRLVAQNSLRFASIMFDADTLPEQWLEILNTRFDVAIAPTQYATDLFQRSGLEIPFVKLPLAIDLDPVLSAELRAPLRKKVRFGSIAAFHRRKDPEVLLRAFLQCFHNREDVELVLHSNLAFEDTLGRLYRIVEEWAATNVTISHSTLSEAEKGSLLDSIDVFASCSRGEGYSVGPREALARGKVLAISDVGGHKELAGVPGVFMIPATIRMPARFPEIDNLIFGEQRGCVASDVKQILETAYEYVRSPAARSTAHERRELASQFSFSRLASSYAALINTNEFNFRRLRPAPNTVHFPRPAVMRIASSLGPRADKLRHTSRMVIQAYDGGFFSVFNSYLSHLVWGLHEERCQMVLPDWNVRRVIAQRSDFKGFTSWCYAGLDEGNAWTSLFEPLFGLSDSEMDDPEILYGNASRPVYIHNEDREPLLTYFHAYKLYRSQTFAAWRRQYHRVFRDHVKLRPELETQISAEKRRLNSRFMIGAHVRHPSHKHEQPTRHMADTDDYILAIRKQITRRDIELESNDWRVFLATDQEQVVHQFVSAFGDRVWFFTDVTRTSAEDDLRYNALSSRAHNSEGHQVQHLAAAVPERWSSRLGWEILRDTAMLANCHALLHVTSNVSTAVSYMNPNVELIYCHSRLSG